MTTHLPIDDMGTQLRPEPPAHGGEGALARTAALVLEMAPDRAEGATPSLAAWLSLGSLVFLALFVFWGFDALPFQDLPGHAGLIAIRHRFATSPFDQRFFVFTSRLGPYSLFLLLGETFDRIAGPVAAVRALATLPLLATPAALLYARRKLHHDTSLTAGFFGIALSFGFMTLMGLASYLLGLAIMLVAVTVWLDMAAAFDSGQPTLKKEIEVGILAFLTFVGHGHAFVLLLMVTALASIPGGIRPRRLTRLTRSFLPSLAVAAWCALNGGPPPGAVPRGDVVPWPHFQGIYEKLSLLVTPTLMTRTGIDILLGAALWVLIISASIVTLRSVMKADPLATEAERKSRMHSRALASAAIGIGVLFFVLPHSFGWFGFIDGRLVPLFLLLSILGIRREALSQRLRTALDQGATLIALCLVALVLFASYRFQGEATGYREVLSCVPSEAHLLNLPLDPYSDYFTAHPFIHYDKLVATERPVLLSDVWSYPGSALYPKPDNPELQLPSSYSESNLQWIDWPAYHMTDWDYVLIRVRPSSPPPYVPVSLTLAKHVGGWWLYRRADGA